MSLTMSNTDSRYLDVLDVSNIIYVATAVSSSVKDKRVVTCKGVNIAGVTEIIQRVAMNYQLNRRTVLCLDSFSEKRAKSSSYKSNRVFHPEIAVQSEIIEQYFSKFGVEVLKQPGMEADDLMYSVVYGSKDNHMVINLHTGDSDIYGAVIAPHISIIGTSSQTPSFNEASFSKLCDSHLEIPFNTILPNKVFYGKASNAIGVLKLSKPKEYYYNGFVSWMIENKKPMQQGSELDMLKEFLRDCLSKTNKHVEMSLDEINEVIDRSALIYPTIKPITIPNKSPDIDVEALIRFLQFYNEFTACKMFGLNNQLNTIQVGKEYDTFIRRMLGVVKNGTYRADNHLGGDAYPIGKITSEFMSIEEW